MYTIFFFHTSKLKQITKPNCYDNQPDLTSTRILKSN